MARQNSDIPDNINTISTGRHERISYENEGFENERKNEESNGKIGSRKNIMNHDEHVIHLNETVAQRLKAQHEKRTRSWWYSLCLFFRNKEENPWEPSYWRKVCPHPYCPSYRDVSRMTALVLTGLMIWGICFAALGDVTSPHGQLFGMAVLILIGNFGGWLTRLATLPGLIGMILTGLLLQNIGMVNIAGPFVKISADLRKVALVIILTRAGLELDATALLRLKYIVLRAGIVPWFVEAIVITVSSYFLLGLPWDWAFLLGSIISAIAPAVVVPCLLRLRARGYGVAKGIPTLIVAVAGIDDALSVALFGIVSSIMLSSSSLAFQIAEGPVSIIGGLLFGFVYGWCLQYVPERNDPFAVPLRVILLLCGGLIAVFGSKRIDFEGAGPLGVITAAFFASYFWSKQGWEVGENPVSVAFEIFWMVFEPILFTITGAQVKLKELDPDIVTYGAICLGSGIIIRLIVTYICAIKANLNNKEKIFVGISWMAKGTVQAALGPLALQAVKDDPIRSVYATKILMVCIFSIIMTAPLGALTITLTGPRLLTKTKAIADVEGWRRSHRPSIKDIAIEDDENDDEEKNEEEKKNVKNDSRSLPHNEHHL